MKKILLLALVFSLILSACAVPFLQPTVPPAPTVDLQATAAVFVQASLQAQPTPTLAPSNTPVVSTPSLTEVSPTPTETQNSALLTLTATLGTGTAPAGTPLTPAVGETGTLPVPSATNTPSIGATATQTLHPRFFGTLPPLVPFGKAKLINKAKAEAYISLQCTTADGRETIIEYPVRGIMEVKIPLGRYVYVAWVGGNKMVGNFSFNGSNITILLYKDSVVIKQ